LIAYSQNELIELKAGAVIALVGYAVSATINFMNMSGKDSSNEVDKSASG